MQKKLLIFLVGAAAFLFLAHKSTWAKQFDHLQKLQADQSQQSALEENADDSELWYEDAAVQQEEEEGDVLGTNDDFILNSNNRGPHFYFGEIITVDENLTGDVYVFAGDVTVNGVIDGDLIVAGGNVTLNGEVMGDVRAAGGSVYINGIIGQNLTLAGGMIRFSKEARVGNSVVAGGGSVTLDGEIAGNVFLGGGATRLAGIFGSDVNVMADDFEVAPGVMVAGSLMAEAGRSAEVSSEAQISGNKDVKILPKSTRENVKNSSKTIGTFGIIIMFLAGAISGSVLLYLVPKLSLSLSNSVVKDTLASIGWGFAYFFLTPILILFIAITVIGLPLAGILTLIYILSMVVAGWISAYALGLRLQSKYKWTFLKNKYYTFIFGLFLLTLVSIIPVFGWLIKFLAFLMGLGALFMMFQNKILSKKA